ncbi:heavy metal RND efflux outer membrane protein, CzcC family [Piscinibacter sakaiensis]|uniref:Heavy metal RND efflux outer membrane protein, CzcC family n=2 Tax=Piscinibacter sakaiensis TaxID=1547922 RepID=A0A0K8NV56_PISS1|nr:heavy metal RND efflux outer membrane protein, CzcC family [Piscinibacter sakaiensis]
MAAAWLPALGAVAAPLTLEQAVELAVQRSQMTQSARASAMSAAQMARAAGQQPDPMLTLGIDNLPATGRSRFSTNAEDMTMKRIGLAQEWVSVEKRAAREAAAQAMAGRETVMERVAAADARLQSALAYIEAYYAGEAAQLTALNERHAREELEAGKGRLATVSGSSAEVLGLASALGAAEDESAELLQQKGGFMATLQRWTGVTGDELSEPRLAVAPSQEGFVAAHPLVVARQREIDVARQEVEVARLNRKPNWSYEVSYGQRVGRPDLVSLGVSIPLPIAPDARQDRETAAKRALVDKAEADAEEARRAAAGEYAALANDARRLQERIDRLQAAVVEPLKQRTAATLAAYRSNRASLVMLFEARHAEVEAQRKVLNLRRDLAKVQAQLVFKPIALGALQ